MILSYRRYQKGNLMAQKRLSAIGALRPKMGAILAGVTQLHISAGSVHWNRAKRALQ
jgi:hypothetical protein